MTVLILACKYFLLRPLSNIFSALLTLVSTPSMLTYTICRSMMSMSELDTSNLMLSMQKLDVSRQGSDEHNE
jgi:hypothetical protein